MSTLQTGVTLTLTKAEVSLLINSLENDVDMMSHSTLRMLKELT